MFNDQKLLQWFFGLLDVGASAIIMGWGVVEKREPEMGGCCVLSSLGVFFQYFFYFLPAHPHSVLDYVGLSPGGREEGGLFPTCRQSQLPLLTKITAYTAQDETPGSATSISWLSSDAFQRHF